MPEIRSQPDDATNGGEPPAQDGRPATASPAGAATVAELERRVHELEREREELARRLREVQDAPQRARREVVSRDEILGAVIHDLRNPLGTIMLAATALLEPEVSTDPKAQRIRNIGDRVHRQAERMNQQLTNLADFAELQAGNLELHREPRAPAEIIAAAEAQLAPLAHERGIRFEAQVAAGLPPVLCDHERVLQVFWNLVTTAFKGTTRGGTLEIGAVERGAAPVFFLRDRGPGLDTDELNAVFGRAPPDRRPHKRSTLLGFTIARGFVEAQGGTMWAEPEPGAGATVYFGLASPSQLTERDRSSTITDVCPPAP